MSEVSIIMSVYNGEAYMRQAVESLLAQTYREFELLIVDDASTDGTRWILEELAAQDGKIRIITNPTNLGLTRSLNLALRQTHSDLIARMDADDVALPTRLEKQVAFLDTHPDVSLVGTWYQLIDDDGHVIAEKHPPTDDAAILHALPRYNPFLHSSVMVRRTLLDEVNGYDETYRRAQDYDLWLRLSPRTRLANLPEILMQKRFTPTMVSYASEREQLRLAVRARWQAIRRKQYAAGCLVYLVKPLIASLLPSWIVHLVRIHVFGQRAYQRSLGSSRSRRSG